MSNVMKPLSNVYSNCRDFVYTFDFDSVSVLARQQNVQIRKQLEGIYTFKKWNTFNRAPLI